MKITVNCRKFLPGTSFIGEFSVVTSCLILLLVVTYSPANAQKIAVDLVIINARVRTMDNSQPNAEAVAVTGN